MADTEFSGIEYADGTDLANLATVSRILARDVDKFLGVFTTETARDNAKTAYLGVSGRIASDANGMRAFVTNRAGWCYWRGDKWVWESTHDLLIDEHWSGPAVTPTPSSNPLNLLTPAAITVPGTGFRRLMVSASVNLRATTGGGVRAYVTGPGISAGEGLMQQWIQSGGVGGLGEEYRGSVGKTYYPRVASGTQTYSLKGLVEGSTAIGIFADMSLQIMDLGPSD